MKLEVTKEWCLKMAELEGDSIIGAGALARDPDLVEPGFHWQDGWYFFRLKDGSVRVRKYDGGTENPPIIEAIIPAPEWASIVCSVSAEGETADRWDSAQDFHGR